MLGLIQKDIYQMLKYQRVLLGDIFVCAADKPHDLAVLITLCGQHDDRDLAEAPDGLAGLNAIHHRHHNIENGHRNIAVLPNQLHSLLPIGCLYRFISLIAKEIPHKSAPTLFIICNQDLHTAVHAPFAS